MELPVPNCSMQHREPKSEIDDTGQFPQGASCTIAAVYTMDWPGPVICMYVCVGTVSHVIGPTDPLVVARAATRNEAPRPPGCIG